MSCDFLANFEIRDEFVFYLAAQIIRSFTDIQIIHGTSFRHESRTYDCTFNNNLLTILIAVLNAEKLDFRVLLTLADFQDVLNKVSLTEVSLRGDIERG